VALLCVGGVGIAYHEYDKATKPNRSAPDVVVDNYLRASLVDRDGTEEQQYACADQSGLATFKGFRDSLLSRASSLGGEVSFTWGSLIVHETGNDATVDVQLVVDSTTSGGLAGQSRHDWTFTTVDVSNWRVCGASQTS
jgi:hypothetical protein